MPNPLTVPSASILFTISQKAESTNRNEDRDHAVLNTFVRMFDHMCGYYDKQRHIAKFERDLDDLGLLDDFCAAFQEIASKPWIEARERHVLYRKHVDHVYARIMNEPEDTYDNFLEGYRNTYRISVDSFVDDVCAYIKKQKEKLGTANFRLNFFVDEVGQFIADNTKLMLELQAISETLTSRCGQNAWLFVTSQEDLTGLIGNRKDAKSYDFSKIQARFRTHLKLNSKDVAEVIRKRLLLKSVRGKSDTVELYENTGKQLTGNISFTGDNRTYAKLLDEEDFVSCYPFLPYQFDLFQETIFGLSKHGAFSGRHGSRGERSMLAGFCAVLKDIKDKDFGCLVSFDQLFTGIDSLGLQTYVTQSIHAVENRLENPMAPRLMKVLLMLKYVEGFKANARNLSVLLTDSVNDNPADRQAAVTEALQELEQETYIRRDGDLYSYLTDEEKTSNMKSNPSAARMKTSLSIMINSSSTTHSASPQTNSSTEKPDRHSPSCASRMTANSTAQKVN